VITRVVFFPERTTDEVLVPEVCRHLEAMGASVVGFNCAGKLTGALQIVKKIKEVVQVGIPRCIMFIDISYI